MKEDNWVTSAEHALLGEPPRADVLWVERGHAPPGVGYLGVRALIAGCLAAFVGAAAVFQQVLVHDPLAPLPLLLRTLAFALVCRTLLFGLRCARAVADWRASRKSALVLTQRGLLLRMPEMDRAVARIDIADVVFTGRPAGRSHGKERDVYLVTRPGSGVSYVRVPPWFGSSAEELTERLRVWAASAPRLVHADAVPQPVELEDAVAEALAGHAPPGVSIVKHGRGWAAKGPYLSGLFALALLYGAASRQGGVATASSALVGLSCILLLVPLGWFVWKLRGLRPGRTVALVIGRAGIWIRAGRQPRRLPWSRELDVVVHRRASWSFLDGYHTAHELRLGATGARRELRLEDAYLEVPAETAAAILQMHNPLGQSAGSLPRESTAEQTN
jgi:hypothetical protein